MKLEPKIIELLNKRGICSEEEIEEFLSEHPRKTYDPFLLLNMRTGVDLIMSAIRENKKICVYGDYDADGITSTVIMMEVLSELTDNLMYYIPSRFEEGYGLNIKAIDRIHEQGAEFLLTVDCGSVSVEEVDYAHELGMTVLVTDHHQVTDVKADCPVINPNQPGDTYPCSYIAGCGVAFKLSQALVAENGLPKMITTRALDMLGIGTIGDIVPLVDENRTFAKYGLRAINTSGRKNLAELIDAIGLHRGHITAENVSFGIVPHLNAAGRMLHAANAVELFLAKDPAVVKEKTELLVRCNRERKDIQERTFQGCRTMVEGEMKDDRFLLIDLPDAHEGITGIVAGKIKEEYHKPVVIFTPTGEGNIKGTGRSIEGISIYEELKKSQELFLRFGGHAAACGLTMNKSYLPVLRENLFRQMAELEAENPDIFRQHIDPDLILDPADLNLKLLEELDMLEPCGKDNEKPLIMVTGHPYGLRRIGGQGQFLKFTMILEGGMRLPCVAFNKVDQLEAILNKGGPVRAAGALSLNEWNGNKEIQMLLADAEEGDGRR